MPELERIIDCTLNERSWVLPAHSGGKLPQLTEIAQSCLVSLHNYFEDYPDDGDCDEGAQY